MVKKKPNELYSELELVKYRMVNKVSDQLEGHHIPAKAFIKNLKTHPRHSTDPAFKAEVDTYDLGYDSITIMMEQWRHKLTANRGVNAINPDYLKLAPLEALKIDLENLRDIYRSQSLYTTEVESKINQFEKIIKTQYPNIFK